MLTPLLLLAACSAEPPQGDLVPTLLAEVPHGRLERVGALEVLRLEGTREEMGRAEGALLCGRVTRLVQDYIVDFAAVNLMIGYPWLREGVLARARVPDADRRQLAALREGMESCPAGDLELRIRGPEGVQERPIELEDLVVATAIGDVGCSSFSAWGAAARGGGLLLGRTFDYPSDPGGTFVEAQLLKVYREPDGARWASVSLPGLVGCITCVTDGGAALAVHNAAGAKGQGGGLVPRLLAARDALLATRGAPDPVAAAEAVLEAAPQGVGNAFHLVLPGGEGAVVLEVDGQDRAEDGRVTVRRPGALPSPATREALVLTNHFGLRDPPRREGDSAERYRLLAEGLDRAAAAGGLEPAGARRLLGGVGRGITAHALLLDLGAGTLDLWVAEGEGEDATDAPATRLELRDLLR